MGKKQPWEKELDKILGEESREKVIDRKPCDDSCRSLEEEVQSVEYIAAKMDYDAREGVLRKNGHHTLTTALNALVDGKKMVHALFWNGKNTVGYYIPKSSWPWQARDHRPPYTYPLTPEDFPDRIKAPTKLNCDLFYKNDI